MARVNERHATVIGAGIGGLAAAIALRHAGWEVTVYERANALLPVGAGLSLWSNAMYALNELGRAAAMRSLGVHAHSGAFRSWRGDVLSRFDLQAHERRLGQPTVVVERAAVQRVLLDALPPETVRLGAACVGFVQDVRGVTARFADGTNARAAVLIGADGIHSAVRGQLFGWQPTRYAGYTVYRGVAPFPHARLLPGESVGRGQRFGMFPLSGERVYWYAVCNAPEGMAADVPAILRARFAAWHDPIPAILAAVGDAAPLHTDIHDRPLLPRWSAGRVTLLGDAAHPMTPNLGQGACQAMEDAVVLGRCLASAWDVPAALVRYERARIPRTRAIARQARHLGEVLQWAHPVACAARDAVFARLPDRVVAANMATTVGYAV